MRIRFCVNGNFHNVHLVVVPFFDRHTAENTVKLITTLLEMVCAPWKDKIIAITTDGENTNTGWRNGVVARLNRMATHQLMRVWCAPHQGDIVIRAATNEMDYGAFYKTPHAFSVHLRQQQNLILEIQVQYPPADNRILSFMLKHRRRLEHCMKRNGQYLHHHHLVGDVRFSATVAELCNTTMTIIQLHDMILCQQMAEIKSLIGHLLVKLRTGTFISDVLDKYRAHIGLYWSAEDVEQVEANHRVNDVGLVKAYNQEPSTKALIDDHTLKTNFNDAWASIGSRFTFLRQFSGGLAVAFANTTSVESDFSILKWENDNFRQSMSNLTLEGIFQDKRRGLLDSLVH
ncbi:hypothetical protein PsorP6_008588 [Peronosclerospora sorghi]|uniref:Uncharacterized protein n=1 Tax=Peronosclerospora sorghi TaxID=230839 RepID=A0ACC0WDL6_9STRA|nr:hypothetical protein PsorP6_008588 [Peronosclerospora sorghi]